MPMMLGDERAEMFALLIARPANESVDAILARVESALARMPAEVQLEGRYQTLAFNMLQQSAIHATFSMLEHALRDTRLAAHVAAERRRRPSGWSCRVCAR